LAQTTPDLLKPRFQADPTRNYLVTPAAETNDDFAWNVGLLLGYAHKPLRLVDADGNELGELIDSQLYGSLMASIAVAQRLQLSLDLPVALSQNAGDNAAGVSATATAIGDLRAQAVVNLFSTRKRLDEAGVALGIIGEIIAPTGDGDNFTGGALRGGGGLVLEAFANDRTHFAISGLYRAAPTVNSVNSRLDDAIRWSLAAERRIRNNWSIVGDLVGEFGTGNDGQPGNQRPMELLGAGRWHNGIVYTQFGGGLGLTTGVGTPVFRVFAGLGITPRGPRWAGQPPEPVERLDGLTQQPEPEPEPEPVPEPEPEPAPECTDDDMSGCTPAPAPQCQDGALVTFFNACVDGTCVTERNREACPIDHACVVDDEGVASCQETVEHVPTAVVDDTRQEIVINEVIRFRFDSDELDAASYPIIDRIAEVIERESDIAMVRIEGHTDFIGDNTYNQTLSERRARRVLNELVERGIDPARLSSIGFGDTRPIDTARTTAARARNRRVEFHIEVAP
jgi:outer membrane protein OmpA-like peptidoglycan-associated protein